jgi:2'-hydroxyisoflavone reductase
VELLADKVEHYTFLSTVSAYEDRSKHGIDESDATVQLSEENSENVPVDYRGLKARSEKEVEKVMGNRALNVRAGLLVGPYDDTGRFTYWVRRISQGGRVLAPGDPYRPVQFIHARDLADWIIRMAENRSGGVYNATGPKHKLTMQALLVSCRSTAGGDASFTWVDESFLLEHEVIAFTELPLWLRTVSAGMLAVNIDKALAAGLTFRPLADTIAETLAWDKARSSERDEYAARLYNASETNAGMASAREEALLSEWDVLNPPPKPIRHRLN